MVKKILGYKSTNQNYEQLVLEFCLSWSLVFLKRLKCPDRCPLLAFVSLLAPAAIKGNIVAIIPSQSHPMVEVDTYQVSPWLTSRVACPSNFARVRVLSPASYSPSENSDLSLSLVELLGPWA